MPINLRMWAKGRVRERKRERANVFVCVFCAQCCGEEEEEALFSCAIAVVAMPTIAVCFIFPLA
jgi:hypothetical protein